MSEPLTKQVVKYRLRMVEQCQAHQLRVFIYGNAGLRVPHSSKDAGLTHNHWLLCL